jgi:hypothetical protein
MGQLFSGDKRSENMDAGRESYAGISDDLQINNGAPLIDIYYDSKYRSDASFKHGGR